MSFSLNPTSCGVESPSASQLAACRITSFIEPVTERFRAFAKQAGPLAGSYATKDRLVLIGFHKLLNAGQGTLHELAPLVIPLACMTVE